MAEHWRVGEKVRLLHKEQQESRTMGIVNMESNVAGQESRWRGGQRGRRGPGQGCHDCQMKDFPLNLSRRMKFSKLSLRLIG